MIFYTLIRDPELANTATDRQFCTYAHTHIQRLAYNTCVSQFHKKAVNLRSSSCTTVNKSEVKYCIITVLALFAHKNFSGYSFLVWCFVGCKAPVWRWLPVHRPESKQRLCPEQSPQKWSKKTLATHTLIMTLPTADPRICFALLELAGGGVGGKDFVFWHLHTRIWFSLPDFKAAGITTCTLALWKKN